MKFVAFLVAVGFLSGCGASLSEYAGQLDTSYVCENTPEYSQRVLSVLRGEADPLAVLKADFDKLKASSSSPAKALAEATCAVMAARAELVKLQDVADKATGAIRTAREAAALADQAVKELGKI